MRHRTLGMLLLALSALPLTSPANETMDSRYLPLWSIRHVIRANATTLDFTLRTRLAKATVTVGVAVNGTGRETLDLSGPVFKRGPFFMYEGALDLTGYSLKAGDVLTLTATVTDGRVTATRTATVRVHAAKGGVVIVPGVGGVVTQP